MHKILAIVFCTFVCIALSSCQNEMQKDVLHGNIELYAEYWPGYGENRMPWNLRVYSGGNAKQECYVDMKERENKELHSFILSRNAIENFAIIARNADFASLQDKYSVKATDYPTHYISLTINGNTKSVKYTGGFGYPDINLADSKDRADINRFEKMWNYVEQNLIKHMPVTSSSPAE